MRSPVRPWSARSFKSEGAIRRPSGIFPAGNVFHVPPPAVDAKALDVSVGTGCADGAFGCSTATAAATEGAGDGIGVAAAITIGDLVATGEGVVTATATGFATDLEAGGAAGCCATTGAARVGATEGAGAGVGFWFFANLPFFGGGVAFAS